MIFSLLRIAVSVSVGQYKGKYTGTWGDAGAWSLNYYKVISCGEGGLVFTDDYDIYERAAVRGGTRSTDVDERF